MTGDTDTTVLLSDAEAAPILTAGLGAADEGVAWYASMDELVRERSLSSIGVLVLHFRPLPKGVVLVALGRMNVEYPGMQKVAVLESPLPLPLAEFLTACGVDLYWPKENGVEGLGAVVDRMRERTQWVVT